MKRKEQQKNIIVGLDVGTTKICVVVGRYFDDEIKLIATVKSHSLGVKKGIIVDIEATVISIKKALEKAEFISGYKLSSAYIGIADENIRSINSCGILTIKGSHITKRDVNDVINAAKSTSVPMNHKIIHIVPQEYIVDKQVGIKNPIGMKGVRLEVKVHIITGTSTSIHNLFKCANKAGLNVCRLVLKSLASSYVLLNDKDKELGIALIDIGGGTSDLIFFKDRTIKHTFVLPLGGNNLTKDISIGTRTVLKNAERIKKQFGTCQPKALSLDNKIKIRKIGNPEYSEFSRQTLVEIVEARVEEIFYFIHEEMCKVDIDQPPYELVLSGGTSLLDGIVDLAESTLGIPARIENSNTINCIKNMRNNPLYITGIGLVLYGIHDNNKRRIKTKNKKIFQNLIAKIRKRFASINFID